MPNITDPAAEFASLCQVLSQGSRESGATWMAENFETDAWSRDFYRILFAIVERAHFLKSVVYKIEEARHIADQANIHLDEILRAFNPQNLGGTWSNSGMQQLGPQHVGPIVMLSAVIRPHIQYPLLSTDEREEILELANELNAWLVDHQLNEQDFIRQALINGLDEFIFRLERLRWLGWGYSLEALKDVIGAYLALEKGFVDDNSMPMVDATLKKVAGGIRAIYEKAGVAKDVTETSGFMLKAYGTAAAFLNASTGGVQGLLTFGG